jgi:hypothetical protein
LRAPDGCFFAILFFGSRHAHILPFDGSYDTTPTGTKKGTGCLPVPFLKLQ